MKPDFDKMQGLVPVVVQDAETLMVLMLGYMNPQAYKKTLETGLLHMWSRSRNTLWMKGESSGHIHKVVSMALDCDQDALLVKVKAQGPTCHTGAISCFFNTLQQRDRDGVGTFDLKALEKVVQGRAQSPKEGSYTTSLLRSGIERISKKILEESGEVVIALLREDNQRVSEEIADLLYHLLVAMTKKGLSLRDVERVLANRRAVAQKK